MVRKVRFFSYPCVNLQICSEYQLIISLLHNRFAEHIIWKVKTNPEICSLQTHCLHSSTTLYPIDFVHASLPVYGTHISWSPLSYVDKSEQKNQNKNHIYQWNHAYAEVIKIQVGPGFNTNMYTQNIYQKSYLRLSRPTFFYRLVRVGPAGRSVVDQVYFYGYQKLIYLYMRTR